MALFGKNKGEKIRDLENDVASLHVKLDNLKRKNASLEKQIETLHANIDKLGNTKMPERISTWGNAKTIPIQHKTYVSVGAANK